MKKILETTIYYPASFKEKILLEILNGQISADGARNKYNIGGKMTIYRWLAAYNNSKKEKVLSLPCMSKKEKIEEKTSQEVTPEEFAKLKKQLEEALLKAEAYKTLLEIGKEKFGIDLEKKHGAKQSKD